MTGPLAALVLASATLVPLHVTIEERTPPTNHRAAIVVASPAALGEGGVVEAELPSQHADIWLRKDVAWQLSCRGTAVWCPTVAVAAGATTATLPLYAATSWRARLLAPKGQLLPREAVLQGWLRSGGSPLSYRVALPVNTEGGVEIALPAALQDLRISVAGFAPAYRWRLDARTPSLKPEILRLVSGGSLSGVVIDSGTRLPAAGIGVELAPAAAADGLETKAIEPVALFEATTDERGFFQIAGLGSGTYRLHAGAADRRGIEVAVEVDQETFLPAVALATGLRLNVSVDPPQDPAGRPWRVEVESGSFRREADTRDGSALLPDVPVGFAKITVSGEDLGRVGYREVEVDSDRELSVDLGLVRVAGEVTLGGTPMPADIRLTTGKGDQVTLSSDEDGAFTGWIPAPRDGWAQVNVVSRTSPQVRRTVRLPDLTVRDGRVELRLDLPDSRVAGIVVDESGEPVPEADISAVPVDGSAGGSSFTDKQGRFEARGLAAAAHTVMAASHGRSSETVTVDLSAGDVEGLRLVLLGGEEREGVLLSAEGLPVGGAEVQVTAFGQVASWARVETSSDGGFRFSARRGTSQVMLVVLAPSQLLWTGCVAFQEDQRLVVRLPPRPGGELDLRLNQFPAPPGDWFVVSSDGGSFSWGAWLEWESSTHGVMRTQESAGGFRFQLPRVAAGGYALVWTDHPQTMAQAACRGLGAVDWKLLAPGSRVELTTPAAPK